MICFQKGPAGLTAKCSVFHSGSQDSEKPLVRQSDGDQRSHLPPASPFHPKLSSGRVEHQRAHVMQSPTLKTQTWTAVKQQKAAENKVNMTSDGVGKTEASTKGPTLQPTQATRSTEPPFIGDEYMTEDIPSQTVSFRFLTVHILLVFVLSVCVGVSQLKPIHGESLYSM